MICYVCNRELEQLTDSYREFYFLPAEKQLKHITSPISIGNDIYRHRRCEPGGSKWMQIQASLPRRKRSEFYDYFLMGKVPHHENKV